MVTGADQILKTAHEAVQRRSWVEAAGAFNDAAKQAPLSPDDLETLAEAAWWAGEPDESIDALERAYAAHVDRGDNIRAAGVATLLMEMAGRRVAMSVSAGWRSKAERLLEGSADTPVHARMKMFDLLTTLFSGDLDTAVTLADETIELAQRAGDHNTEVEAQVFKGRALVGRGDWQEGTRLIDEAAATALSGGLGLRSASNVYCCTIEACRAVGDYRRAGEWTEEADRWMSRHSVEGYPGVCEIRRAELKRLRGDWSEAETEATRACETLERYRLIDEVGLGEIQVGLIHLQMGDYDGAEAIFNRAFEHGADPHPGLALLMLARGKVDDAAHALEASLANKNMQDLPTRMLLLPVQVQIALVRGDLTTAETAVDELERVAAEFGRPAFEATSAAARGEFELTRGHPTETVATGDRALRLWRELDFPYETAKVRVLLARAHLELGDAVRARMELEAARSTFQRLGAQPDLERVDDLAATIDRRSTGKARTTKTFMFTDIVTSTDLIGLIGDDAWGDLLTWHDRELRSVFAAHSGVEVNHAGDGFFVVFDTPEAAIDAAVAIQRALTDHRRRHGFAPAVRIGIHTGEASVEGSEYRGQEVHLAARVASAAGGEEIMVSALVLDSAGSIPHRVSPGTETQLKGIADPVVLHTIDWR